VTTRTAGRRRHDEPAEIDGFDPDDGDEGIVTRLAVRVMENPAMSGGLIVMALTAVAVVSNALFLQQAQHPEPWFATRPAPMALAPGSDDLVVPDPRPRAERPPQPPMPHEKTAEESTPTVPPTLIADLQRALSERGFYRGKIDGISGSRTRAAITAYEQSQGLKTSGEPSPRILEHIMASAVDAPAPLAAPGVAATPAPAEVTISSLAEAPVPAPPEPVETASLPSPAVQPPVPPSDEPGLLSYPPRADQPAATPVVATPVAAVPIAATPLASTPAAASAPAVAAASPDLGARRTLSVQKALNLIGYGPVPEDGVANEATIGAIRRFELDNGLPITGAAGDTLIDRLVAIGALQAA